MFHHGRHHVLAHGHGREQRTVLEHDTPAALDLYSLVARKLAHVLAKHLDLTRIRGVQTDNGAQQDRLARPRSADNAQHLAPLHIEIEVLMNRHRPEAIGETSHADDRVVLTLRRGLPIGGGGVEAHTFNM